MNKLLCTLCLLAIALPTSGCVVGSGDNQTAPNLTYQKITPTEAQTMMTPDTLILDVRTQTEYDEGHIPNAILLPDTEVATCAAELLPDKNQTILVYCRSGRRSANSAQVLVDMGYTQVYDLGGILDWTGEVVR